MPFAQKQVVADRVALTMDKRCNENKPPSKAESHPHILHTGPCPGTAAWADPRQVEQAGFP